MNIFDVILIAIALGMDCFTVSITCGIIQRRMGGQAITMASMFGLFQAGMAMAGWFVVDMFTSEIQAYDHWIAFSLLALLGGKMIWEGIHPKAEQKFNPSRFVVILMLSVATSIDALAAGCSFIGMGVSSLFNILVPIFLIGIASFMMSIIGKFLGVKIGHHVDWPTEQVGGFILILIGLKVLIYHIQMNI